MNDSYFFLMFLIVPLYSCFIASVLVVVWHSLNYLFPSILKGTK